MILFKQSATLEKHIEQLKGCGKTIGFVPTMGALHRGHLSLIERSKAVAGITVCSIFVNPTQFNDVKDFEQYPVTKNNDILLLEQQGCDILFHPSVSEIYPHRPVPDVRYNLGEIEYLLEGKYRPGHFQGVCQVVHKLLDIVNPDNLFVGQKDYQQYLVIKKLMQINNKNVTLIRVDTAREESGLALSSRNVRLTQEQKEKAAGISKMLYYLKNNLTTSNFRELEQNAAGYLLENGFTKIDYISIANANTLQPVESTDGGKVVGLIAAFIGEVRLIDNLALNE
jgi:pantoate--beta-alanine ligase